MTQIVNINSRRTMEITIESALLADKALDALKDLNKSMPGKTGYKTERVLDKLKPMVTGFGKTQNKLVVEKYGVQNKDNAEQYTVPEDKMPEFLAELGTILQEKESIESPTFTVAEFDNINVPPGFFSSIKPFLIEE